MKVIVPVEDYLFASAIVDFIAHHKWPKDTQFRVIHVAAPNTHKELSNGAAKRAPSKSAIEEWATRLVINTAEAIKEAEPEVEISCKVLSGDVCGEIAKLAGEWQADLIVAGSHGLGGFSSLMLGSVSLKLAAICPHNVILVKPKHAQLMAWDEMEQSLAQSQSLTGLSNRHTEHPHAQRILVAANDYDSACETIDFVTSHLWQEPAQFKLLSVVEQPRWLGLLPIAELEEIFASLNTARKSMVRKLAIKLRDVFHSPNVEEEVLEGDAKEMIIKAAREWAADIVVLGLHPGKRLSQALLGSVTLAVLSQAPCSVIIVKNSSKREFENQDAKESVLTGKKT